jgi:cell division protein FtsZ
MIIAIGCAGGRIADKLGLPFVAINTDWRELDRISASIKLRIGSGHGAGDPMTGKRAAEKAAKEIVKLCTEPVVLVAGLGRGTGTGATHVVARIARKHGCDVSVVVIWPFYFEGRERLQRAKRALSVLKKYPLTTVFLPELLPLPHGMRIQDAFRMSNEAAVKAVINALRGHGRKAMACDASGGSLFGCCAPSFISPPLGL